jgi:hypothetical protein
MTKSPLEKEPMLSYEMKPIVGGGKGTYQIVSPNEPNEDVEKRVYKSTTSKKQSSLIKTIRKLLPYVMLLQFILILYCVMAYYNFPGLIPLWLNKGHNTTIDDKTTDDNVQNISNALRLTNNTMYETEIHIIVPKVTTEQPPPDHTTLTSIISLTTVQVTATTETTINYTRDIISNSPNNPLNTEPILKDIENTSTNTSMVEIKTGTQDIFVDTYNGTDNIKIYNDFSKYDAVTEVYRVNVTEEGTVQNT